ncbi:MAG: FAD-dependent oxidoreductase [Spirochaetes bacterium]|nr:FAD-dependent oxidoreductase [Spirochaetota bacterium]
MKHEYDCVIVGGGPAGIAAAIALRKAGIADLLLLDRNPRLGGILNQCIHPGFGLSRYDRDLTGPEYARELESEFKEAGIECVLGAMVLEISKSRRLKVLCPLEGCAEIGARTVIVATGCRERTRENLEIAGTRPTGVFMAGQAQNLINLRGYKLGERVLIQGSGDIGLIMARRLTIEGYKVEGVFERLPYLRGLVRNKVQCLDHFGISLRFGIQICEIVGKHRVEGVFVERVDDEQRPIPDTREYFPCDTVLFSVGLIPEVDILKSAGLIPPPGRSVKVNSRFESETEGIFLCGNALHIHDLADNAAKEGEIVAGQAACYLRSPEEYRSSLTEKLPYKPLAVNTRFDAAFFDELADSGAAVCIVCPRGCIVSKKGAPRPRGKAYYTESKKGRFQPMTTTILSTTGGKAARLPVKSLRPIDVARMPLIRTRLSEAGIVGASLSLSCAGEDVEFSVCE